MYTYNVGLSALIKRYKAFCKTTSNLLKIRLPATLTSSSSTFETHQIVPLFRAKLCQIGSFGTEIQSAQCHEIKQCSTNEMILY